MKTEITVGQLIEHHHRSPITIPPNTKIIEAARLMKSKDVGYLVVSEGEQVDAVLSERDIVRKAVAQDLDLDQETVAQIMTTKPGLIRSTDSLFDCLHQLQIHRCQHLPVVDSNKRLLGVVSHRDVVQYLSGELDKENLNQLAEILVNGN